MVVIALSWCTSIAVMTMSACTPPLAEAMLLWDFLLENSSGDGMAVWNVLTVAAQVTLLEHRLLPVDGECADNAEHPMKVLRTLPDLDAERVIAESRRLMGILLDVDEKGGGHKGEGARLLDLMARHAREPVEMEARPSVSAPSDKAAMPAVKKFIQVPLKLSTMDADRPDSLDDLVLDDDDGDW